MHALTGFKCNWMYQENNKNTYLIIPFQLGSTAQSGAPEGGVHATQWRTIIKYGKFTIHNFTVNSPTLYRNYVFISAIVYTYGRYIVLLIYN